MANSNNGSILSTIDRITTNALAASTSQIKFVPASTWQGPKPGYYFGTSDQGTGYYQDEKQDNATNQNGKRPRDNDQTETNQKRKVRFGQDQIKTISPIQTPAKLLEQAEEEQKARKTKSLDLSRGASSLKAFIHNLEKSIAKNELLRVDHPNDPEKFMESELALYEDIAVLNDLATNVEYYETFVELGAVDQLLALLGHENTDVALAVIRLFVELLDPALFVGEEGGLGALMLAFFGSGDGSNGGLGLAIANLSRLHENEEEEMKGIDDIFTLVENLLDLDQTGVLRLAVGDEMEYVSVASVICKSTTFVSYLLKKVGGKNSEGWDMSMKLHTSELLATILQHEDSRRYITNLSKLDPFTSELDKDTKKKEPSVDGIECFLQCIATYRKKDPASEEECECLENVFDGLAASLLNEINVGAFLERQGVELMLRCINEGAHSGFGSMKVLFFALSGPASASKSNCYKHAADVFVDAGGFKMLFPIFMGRKNAIPKPSKICDAGNLDLLRKYAALNGNTEENKKKPSKKMKQVVAANKEWYRTIEAHSIQILYGLTRHLDERSPHDAKPRLLSKFVENDCEKCDRMIELCLKYDTKMRQAEYRYFKSDEAEEAEANGIDVDMAALNARLEGGGELFHRMSSVIAFAASGSKRCHEYLLEQLRTQNSGIGVIKAAIEEFVSILDEGEHREQLKTYLLAI